VTTLCSNKPESIDVIFIADLTAEIEKSIEGFSSIPLIVSTSHSTSTALAPMSSIDVFPKPFVSDNFINFLRRHFSIAKI
jgi:hypothetical protein